MSKNADRELLELAAKAAGYKVRWHEVWVCFVHVGPFNITTPPTIAGQRLIWVPLTDDGDALRLAVKLANTIDNFHSITWNLTHRKIRVFADAAEGYGDDPYEATRRAIVRAAAEIGKAMK